MEGSPDQEPHASPVDERLSASQDVLYSQSCIITAPNTRNKGCWMLKGETLESCELAPFRPPEHHQKMKESV
ncbi:hypothetical protein FQA47_023987 [Oryzias melastigma]|uniref:Uncharacterized protein n=1 Tax=Oryzias melastigma TaxID=30732 RepID=A0A834FTB7_ORYME|nr:hypothetical protein FQA47_023987 [Oryzias melastigma]